MEEVTGTTEVATEEAQAAEEARTTAKNGRAMPSQLWAPIELSPEEMSVVRFYCRDTGRDPRELLSEVVRPAFDEFYASILTTREERDAARATTKGLPNSADKAAEQEAKLTAEAEKIAAKLAALRAKFGGDTATAPVAECVSSDTTDELTAALADVEPVTLEIIEGGISEAISEQSEEVPAPAIESSGDRTARRSRREHAHSQ